MGAPRARSSKACSSPGACFCSWKLLPNILGVVRILGVVVPSHVSSTGADRFRFFFFLIGFFIVLLWWLWQFWVSGKLIFFLVYRIYLCLQMKNICGGLNEFFDAFSCHLSVNIRCCWKMFIFLFVLTVIFIFFLKILMKWTYITIFRIILHNYVPQ